jgi:Arc/MetJ family transcription regulator
MMLYLMQNNTQIDTWDDLMRTTVTIDDALYQQALEMADPGVDKTDIFREAMKTFVRVQAAKRLASLGGATPGMPDIPRHRGETPTR